MVIMIPEVSVSSSGGGAPVPVVGLGTANFPLDPEATRRAVVDAIEVGYRHFDTASLYESEGPLGEAIAEALRRGLVESRDELFVTSKLWCNEAHPELVLPAIRRTLGNLQLDYLDLYLIHWPMSTKPGTPMFPINKQDILPLDLKPVWEAMEECQRLGLARSIGVSNFTRKKLEELLAIAKIPPAVNQVEMNPLWRQKKLRDFCAEKGIHVTAYSPLGGPPSPGSKNPVLTSEVLKKIAEAKGKTVAQVCLRWIYELGASMVMKTFNKERLKKNIEIFDWELSDEDHLQISQLPQHKRISAEVLLSDKDSGTSTDLSDIDIVEE